MKIDCTQAMLRYRDIARVVWNLGFCSDHRLLDYASLEPFEAAMARLFEGMVVGPLGHDLAVSDASSPEGDWELLVEGGNYTELQVDKNLPHDPGHLWWGPTIALSEGSHELKFVSYFDWRPLAPRDFGLVQVLIVRLDGHQRALVILGYSRCGDASSGPALSNHPQLTNVAA